MSTHAAAMIMLVVANVNACSSFSPRSIDEDFVVNMRQAIEDPLVELDCPASREFITAFNYLRADSQLKATPEAALHIAEQVAKGCHGAARRFINISELLVKARLDGKAASKIGIDFAQASDTNADAFSQIFQYLYLVDFLDMDMISSIDSAKALSKGPIHHPKIAAEDFGSAVQFCLSATDGLQLSRAQCYQLALNLSRWGQGHRSSVVNSFQAALGFLESDKKGPQLSRADALPLSEKLVAISPEAVGNFKEAYLFSVAASGLDLPKNKAVEQALKIALATRRVTEPALFESLKQVKEQSAFVSQEAATDLEDSPKL